MGTALTGMPTRELQQGYYRGNLRENHSNGGKFCEITTIITAMGTALTGMPRYWVLFIYGNTAVVGRLRAGVPR